MYGDFATIDGFALSEEQIAELLADPAYIDWLNQLDVAAIAEDAAYTPGPPPESEHGQ